MVESELAGLISPMRVASTVPMPSWRPIQCIVGWKVVVWLMGSPPLGSQWCARSLKWLPDGKQPAQLGREERQRSALIPWAHPVTGPDHRQTQITSLLDFQKLC